MSVAYKFDVGYQRYSILSLSLGINMSGRQEKGIKNIVLLIFAIVNDATGVIVTKFVCGLVYNIME